MRLIVLLLFLPPLLPAQTAFLKNHDIVWAAEIEQDWVVDIPRLEDEWDEGITTLKLFRPDGNEHHSGPPTLAKLVWFGMTSGKLPIFKDANCSIPVDWRIVFASTDNHAFDPDASGKSFKPSFFDPELYHDFKAWRVCQILAYQNKSATWTTKVVSVAPLIVILNEQGDSIDTRPVFWFKPFDDRRDLNSDHIVWAKRTLNRQIKTQVPIVPVKPVKISEGFLDLLPHLRHLVGNRQRIPLYDALNEKVLTPEERLSIISQPDTVLYCFMDGPNGETFQIVQNDIFKDIHQLRLAQTWYWDAPRCRLSICLDAVAPLIDVLDEEGNVRFARPLFYRRTKH